MDVVFFIAAKLVGGLIRVDTWIVLVLALILLALSRRWHRLASRLTAFTLVALLALAIFPLGEVLLQPIEKRYPTNPDLSRVDGILILGGGEDAASSAYWGQMQLNEGGERLSAGLALARRFPDARVLFTGGSGTLRGLVGDSVTEASVVERFLVEQGLAPERLLLENQARNTAENARLSLSLAKPAPDEAWILITSAFHMQRALRSFEAAGWNGLVPYPVDYRTGAFADRIGWNLARNLRVLNTALKERVGQLAYQLTGR